MKRNMPFTLLFLLVLGFMSIVFAQQPDRIEEELFREVNEMLERCRAEGCPRFAPEHFSEAETLIRQARDEYERGGNLRAIQENIEKAKEHLNMALEPGRPAGNLLEKVSRMRNESRELGIGNSAPGPFELAEDKFQEAARATEAGDLDLARSLAEDAEQYYKMAAIEALRMKILKDAENELNMRRLPDESFRRLKSELEQVHEFVAMQQETDFAIGTLFDQVRLKIENILKVAGAGQVPQISADLSIERMEIKPNVVSFGSDMDISVQVRNNGEKSLYDYVILISDRDIGPLAEKTDEYIGPKETSQVVVKVKAAPKGERTLISMVDPRNQIEESDETNNSARATAVIEDRFQAGEPVVNNSQGRILETMDRGKVDTTGLRDLKPAQKTPKNWSKMLNTQHAELADLKAMSEKTYMLELSEPASVFIKVYFFAPEPEKISAQVLRTNDTQPLWTEKAMAMHDSIGLISAQVAMTKAMLSPADPWLVKLINQSGSDIAAEVLIGSSAFIE